MERSFDHDPKSFQIASRFLHAGHHGAKLKLIQKMINLLKKEIREVVGVDKNQFLIHQLSTWGRECQ